MSENPIVSISGLNKWYGDFHVLRDINLEVARGERIVICGPSGSGKSTLIRCINALEEFQEGRIVVDEIELGPNLRRVDEVRREVGMVCWTTARWRRSGCATFRKRMPKRPR
jgi:general L-amino acid transport system ATP-binding protein